MKRFIPFLILLSLSSLIHAKKWTVEGDEREWRNGFVNLSFSDMTLSQTELQDLYSYYGAAFNLGHSFYFHKPIIKKSVRLGLDFTWLDFNYANYRIQHITYTETINYQLLQGEFSMHIGPSLTICPYKKLKIYGYFHYCPSFAVLYDESTNDLFGNYASIFVGGGSLSWSAIGLGAEARFGKTQYKPLIPSEAENWDAEFNGWRAFITFKF